MLCGINYNHRGRNFIMKRFFAIILVFVTAMLITSVSAFASGSNVLELKEYTLSYKALTEIENGTALDELILFEEEYCLVSPSNDGDGIRSEPIDYAIKKLESNNIRITNMVCLYIPEYNGRFVLIITEKKPHLIPFVGSPDFLGLTNGRLYTVSEANEVIYRTLTNNGDISQEVLDYLLQPYGFDYSDFECRSFENFYSSEELFQIMKDLKSKSAPGTSDFSLLSEYKEYSFSHDFLDKLVRGSSISDLISGKEHLWIFPSRYGTRTIALKDGKWNSISGGSYADVTLGSNEIHDGIVRADQIDEAIKTIKQADPSDITDLVCVNLIDYLGNYVCITTENTAYLIPFSKRPDFTGLENGKLYDLAEAYQTLRENFGNANPDDLTDEELARIIKNNKHFDISSSPSTGNSAEMLPAAGSTAAVVMLLTLKKRKRSR